MVLVIVLDFETNVQTGAPVVLTYQIPGEPIRAVAGREGMAEVSRLACSVGWAAHGAAFDAHRMIDLIGPEPVWRAYEAGRVVCTVQGATLQDIRTEGETAQRGYPLDLVAQRLGIACTPDKSNGWRMRYGELQNTPIEAWPADALTYMRDDVVACADILAEVKSEKDLARQTCHDFWLAPLGWIGIRTDAPRVAELGARVRAAAADAQSKCGPLFKPDGTRSMKAIHAAGEAAGIRQRTAPSAKFPMGQLQVTQETIAEVNDPILDAYAEWLTLSAHRDRLLPQLERERLTCRYHLASTGRALAGGAKRDGQTVGTNVQNVPKVGGWRECLIPDSDDHVWVVADFTGLELFTFAEILDHRYGHSALAAALRAGLDGHVTMGARLAGCSREAFIAARRGELGPDAQAYAEEMRQGAKGPNFGLPGGLSPRGLVAYMKGYNGSRITEAEASRLIRLWHESDPCYQRYLDDAKISARLGAPIVAYRSGRVRASTRFTEHANTPFQALGADIAKAAGWQVAIECALDVGPLAGSRLAIFVHDELVVSSPRSRAVEAAHRVETICRETVARWCDHVPGTVEPILMNRWSKKAKPRFDDAGTLIETIIP